MHAPHPPAESHRWAIQQLEAWLDEQAATFVRLRRRIHATPEASSTERGTTALIVDNLKQAGLNPQVMTDNIGVVVDVIVAPDSDTFIALRAELDAVGVRDDKLVPYASTRDDLCHACGHDAHATMVLSAACAAHKHRDALATLGLKHNLRFIFQPAEETAVGARLMINQNVLDSVLSIIAVHVDPHRRSGTIGLRNGPLTSGAKGFDIIIHGRGGHSARPNEAIDPLPAAINIASMLYQLCPRVIDSRQPVVLTIGSLHSGTAANAIPDTSTIRGTLRSTRLESMELVQRRMESIIEGVAQATGCTVELHIPYHAPPTNNDKHIIDVMEAAANDLLGPENVSWIDQPSMGAEDFAFYQELIPGAIIRLGSAGDTAATQWPLHSPRFDIDESVLGIGSKFLLRVALRLAAEHE